MNNDSGRVTSWPNGWHGFLNEHSETTFVTARTHSLPDQRPLLAQAQLPAKLDEPRVKRLGWVAKMPEQRNRPGSWMLCARPRPMPSIHATPLLRIRLRPPTPMFFFEPSDSKDAQRFRLRSATHSERRVPRIGRLVLNEQEERDSPATAISPVLQGSCTALAVLRKPDGLWLHHGGRKPIPGETTALSGYTRPIAAHATQRAKPRPEIELFL
jgi:hypothetical protein